MIEIDRSEPLKETKSDICLLCGKPKGDSDFALICMKCYRKFSAKKTKETGLLD